MAETYTGGYDDLHSSYRKSESTEQPEFGFDPSVEYGGGNSSYLSSLLGDYRLGGQGNSPLQASVMQNAQAMYGNRAVQRYLSGQGTASAAVEDDHYALNDGAQAASGGQVSVQRFPNNPTPEIPSLDPELITDWWGQGPTTWGGELGGAISHERGTFPSGRPFDMRGGFGDIKVGSWQGENGPVHGYQGEAGLFDARLGNDGGDAWLNGGIGTVNGGMTWDGGPRMGGEAGLINLSGGLMGHELFDMGIGTLEDRAGVWDTDDGGWRAGLKANASVGDVSLFKDNVPWLPGIEVNGPSVGAEFSGGNDGFTIGAGTNLIGGAVTMGDFTKGSDTEQSTRFGLGIGDNVGLRGHWTDEDGDGQTEYGFGFDAGVVSYDFKSEDPLRSALSTVMPIPFAQPFGLQNPFLPEGNMTNAAWDTMKGAGNALWDAAPSLNVDPSNFLAGVSDAGSSMWNSASDAVGSFW